MAIFPDMPYAQYHAMPGLRSTYLKALLHSPYAAHLGALEAESDDPEQAAKAQGDRDLYQAVHAALLENDGQPHDRYRQCPVPRNVRNSNYQAWLADNPDCTALSAKQWDKLGAILDAAKQQGIVQQLGTGKGEVTLTWTDRDHGLPCKARLDWLSASRIIDAKHVGKLELRELERMAVALDYGLQCAHFLAAAAANGLSIDGFAHLWIATAAPHDMALVPVSQDLLLYGEARRQEAFAVEMRCRAADVWPRASAALVGKELGLPGWRSRQVEHAAQSGDDAATRKEIEEVFGG